MFYVTIFDYLYNRVNTLTLSCAFDIALSENYKQLCIL